MESAVWVALGTSATSLALAAASLWSQRVTVREDRDHLRRSQARVVLDRYRGPLLSAATELGDRIDNIRCRGFGGFGRPGSDRDDLAKLSTLFRIAQYLGWREVLRTEVQLLRFENERDTTLTAALIGDVVWAFASQSVDDGQGMLWAEEQRGIGELMMVRLGDGSSTCRGYASFALNYEDQFAVWMDELGADWLAESAPHRDRLRLIQLGLFGLVLQLDEEGAHLDRAWLGRVRAELATSPAPQRTSPLETRVRGHIRRVTESGSDR